MHQDSCNVTFANGTNRVISEKSMPTKYTGAGRELAFALMGAFDLELAIRTLSGMHANQTPEQHLCKFFPMRQHL